jgi:hypothetical protein
MASQIQALSTQVDRVTELLAREQLADLPNTLNELIEETGRELNRGDLKQRPIGECETLQKAVELCSSLLKRMPKETEERELRTLKDRVLSLKCGGMIPLKFFADKANSGAFRQFIEANFLQNKLVSLHQKLHYFEGRGPGIPITPSNFQNRERPETILPWSYLEEHREEVIDGDGRVTGYRYFEEESHTLLFETDANGALTSDYSFNYAGIIRCGVKSPDFVAYDRRNPKEWGNQFIVEVWTGLSESNGQAAKNFLGDHSCLVLRDGRDGKIYSVGQFGVCADYQCVDYVTPLAHKTSGLESPDRYVFLPQNYYKFEKHKMRVSEEQFDRLLERVKTDKARPDEMSFSPVKYNCTSWVVKLMREELGFEVDSQMHLSGFLIRQLLPHSWQEPIFDFWENTIGQLPEGVQKALNFLPFVYIPYLVGALVAKVMSLGNRDGITDLPLIDIFFRPWEIYLDHPMMLRRSLAKMPKEPDGFVRLADLPTAD